MHWNPSWWSLLLLTRSNLHETSRNLWKIRACIYSPLTKITCILAFPPPPHFLRTLLNFFSWASIHSGIAEIIPSVSEYLILWLNHLVNSSPSKVLQRRLHLLPRQSYMLCMLPLHLHIFPLLQFFPTPYDDCRHGLSICIFYIF